MKLNFPEKNSRKILSRVLKSWKNAVPKLQTKISQSYISWAESPPVCESKVFEDYSSLVQ
jgi:hypothetical protein